MQQNQSLNQNSAEHSQAQLGNVSPRQSEANSVKDYIGKLRGQLADAYDQLKDYKKLSEAYRGEIEQMRHVLEAVN